MISKWKKTATAQGNSVRPLTEKEIGKIIDNFPPLNLGNKNTAADELALENIKNWLSIELHNVVMIPEKIDEYAQWLYQASHRSLIQPGTSVGMRAASSVSSGMTQLTLSSFHSSGNIRSSGIDMTAAILYASSNGPPDKVTRIFWKKEITVDKILEIRQKIIDVRFSDIIIKEETRLIPKSQSLFRSEGDEGKIILRLKFNAEFLYRRKILLSDIVEKVMTITSKSKKEKVGKKKQKSAPELTIKTKVSATFEGILDIEAETEDNDKAELFYYYLFSFLEKENVSGIENVKNLTPVSIDYKQFFRESFKTEKGWLLYLHYDMMNIFGVKKEKLSELLTTAGFKVINSTDKSFLLDSDPKGKIKDIDAKYNYAVTDGNNFFELMTKIKSVDTGRCYSNDPREMERFFGIEFARTNIIMTVLEIIELGKIFVDVSHLMLIAELMTSKGYNSGVDYQSNSGKGGMTEATSDRSLTALSNSCLFGKEETVDRVSLTTALGTLGNFGSGTFFAGQKVGDKEYYENQVDTILTIDSKKDFIDPIHRGSDDPRFQFDNGFYREGRPSKDQSEKLIEEEENKLGEGGEDVEGGDVDFEEGQIENSGKAADINSDDFTVPISDLSHSGVTGKRPTMSRNYQLIMTQKSLEQVSIMIGRLAKQDKAVLSVLPFPAPRKIEIKTEIQKSVVSINLGDVPTFKIILLKSKKIKIMRTPAFILESDNPNLIDIDKALENLKF